jgi:hypothetical protein
MKMQFARKKIKVKTRLKKRVNLDCAVFDNLDGEKRSDGANFSLSATRRLLPFIAAMPV